jgi:hypothetical protein
MVLSTVLALSAGTAVVSQIYAFKKAPIVDRLSGELADAKKIRVSKIEQAHKDALLCVKAGGGVENCLTEESRVIEEAAKPVAELEKKTVEARTQFFVQNDLIFLSGVTALLSGAVLLARWAFKRKHEQLKQAEAKKSDQE